MKSRKKSECIGKVRYWSKTAAETAKKRVKSSWKGPRPNVYLCSYCDGYHVGHRSRWQEIARRREVTARHRAGATAGSQASTGEK